LPPPPAPLQPVSEPGWQHIIREYFTGGNLVVRVGVIVLFFGVAFLLKYAAEHTTVPIEFRLAGVALGGIVLLVLGWRLRARRQGFALALQGGAVGVLYLTVFAALRLYHLIPASGAFALLAVIAAASAALAVKQNSMEFAMLGAAGGFLAPILASTGQGSHVVLFSYYALLDVGIVAVAWYRSWRPLNLLAFVFTFAIGTAWGVTRYAPELLASTEPFLILYFLMFVAIAVLFALRRAPELKHYVDGTLVFGTPVVAMALQSQLVAHVPFARAYSALIAGMFYVSLAAILRRRQNPSLRLLVESFIALGIAFATLAIPLALDGRWTAASWALEGAAIFWMGLRQQRRLPSTCGPLLQLAAGLAFALKGPEIAHTAPFLNSGLIGALLIAVAGLLSARMATRSSPLLNGLGTLPANALLIWGLLWWLFGAGSELQRVLPAEQVAGAWLALLATTAVACGALRSRLRWPALVAPALLLLPLAIIAAAYWHSGFSHPLAHTGRLAWPLTLVAIAAILYWSDQAIAAERAHWLHAPALWLLAAVCGWELSWQIDRLVDGSSAWSSIGVALSPALLLAVLLRTRNSERWPIAQHRATYLGVGAGGLVLFMLSWSLRADWQHDGNAAPLGYLPLLNPLDIAQGLALLLSLQWMLYARRANVIAASWQQPLTITLAAVLFVWLNAILLRTIHHWAGIPYQLDAMLAATLVQSALSIFWTLLALATMLWAHRYARRVAWIAAAALMAVVVAKLFLIDLARVGTVARIVSFIVVGVLMLVIGYYSPLPPAAAEKKS
jgi:uncharacterized membrane protein